MDGINGEGGEVVNIKNMWELLLGDCSSLELPLTPRKRFSTASRQWFPYFILPPRFSFYKTSEMNLIPIALLLIAVSSKHVCIHDHRASLSRMVNSQSYMDHPWNSGRHLTSGPEISELRITPVYGRLEISSMMKVSYLMLEQMLYICFLFLMDVWCICMCAFVWHIYLVIKDGSHSPMYLFYSISPSPP